MSQLFITAARNKVRFSTNRGLLTVEDLWDLSLESLDRIAVSIDEAVQKHGRKSFIGAQPKEAEGLQTQFDLVKFVIDTKLAEKAEAKTAADREAQVTFLKGLLEKKQLADLENMTPDEIKAKLAALGVTV